MKNYLHLIPSCLIVYLSEYLPIKKVLTLANLNKKLRLIISKAYKHFIAIFSMEKPICKVDLSNKYSSNRFFQQIVYYLIKWRGEKVKGKNCLIKRFMI